MDLGGVHESDFCIAATKHLSHHPRGGTRFQGAKSIMAVVGGGVGVGRDEAEQHRTYPDSQETERRDASTGLVLWNAILWA